MLAAIDASLHQRPAASAALAVAMAGTAAILGAFYFQYVIGLPPCPLCLELRLFYYVGIPLALIVAAAAWLEAPRPWIVIGLGLVAVIFLGGAALATYHAGVEWKLWQGPQDCSGPLAPLSGSDLLSQLQQPNPIVRCDEAPWSFLGLSLAGWNVLISLALVAVALWGLASERRFARKRST